MAAEGLAYGCCGRRRRLQAILRGVVVHSAVPVCVRDGHLQVDKPAACFSGQGRSSPGRSRYLPRYLPSGPLSVPARWIGGPARQAVGCGRRMTDHPRSTAAAGVGPWLSPNADSRRNSVRSHANGLPGARWWLGCLLQLPSCPLHPMAVLEILPRTKCTNGPTHQRSTAVGLTSKGSEAPRTTCRDHESQTRRQNSRLPWRRDTIQNPVSCNIN